MAFRRGPWHTLPPPAPLLTRTSADPPTRSPSQEEKESHQKSSDRSVSSISPCTQTKINKHHAQGKNLGRDVKDGMRTGGMPHRGPPLSAACELLGEMLDLIYLNPKATECQTSTISSCCRASHSLSHAVPTLSVQTGTETDQSNQP